MGAITVDHFAGGARLQKDHGGPDLAALLRDAADDLAGIQVGTIASDDASDLGTAITLVNEIKAALNVNAGHTLLTTKA